MHRIFGHSLFASGDVGTSVASPRPHLSRSHHAPSAACLLKGRNISSSNLIKRCGSLSVSSAAAAATTAADTVPSAHTGAQPSPPHNAGMLAVHGGERSGRPDFSDTLTTPVACNSTYWFKNTQQVIDFNEGRARSHEYGRYGNPTTRTCELKIMELEGAEEALVSASGVWAGGWVGAVDGHQPACVLDSVIWWAGE